MLILLRMNFFLGGGIAYTGAYSTFIRTFLLSNFSIFCNPQTLVRPLFISFKRNKVFYVLSLLRVTLTSHCFFILSVRAYVKCVLAVRSHMQNHLCVQVTMRHKLLTSSDRVGVL